MMRSLALTNPGDARATAQDDEYLFGPDLLVAPVLSAGQSRRSVYLPRGRWVDLWRSARFVEKPGALVLGRARLLTGRRTVDLPAPLDELPMLVRAGSVLPLLPADVDTLTGYGRARGLVHLKDRRRRTVLLAFPRGKRRVAMWHGEALVSSEGRGRTRGRWNLRIAGKVRRRYTLHASLAILARPFRPCGVTLDGRPLPRRAWRYNRRTRVLDVGFRTKRGVLSVGSCGKAARAR